MYKGNFLSLKYVIKSEISVDTEKIVCSYFCYIDYVIILHLRFILRTYSNLSQLIKPNLSKRLFKISDLFFQDLNRFINFYILY